MDLIQMSQRLIDRLIVLLDNGFTALAIGLFDALLNLRYGLLARQDAAQREEAGLHDRIDAIRHAQITRHLMRVNHIEAQPLVEDVSLGFLGQRPEAP
jgi:hypothetical protein